GLRVEDFSSVDWLSSRTLSLLGRTILLGGGASAIATAIGVPFGFLVSRTDVWGREFARPLSIVALLLPPLFLAITWTALCDVRGALATVCILGASTFPIVAFFTATALDRIGAAPEEAARLIGGTPAALRMQFPLILPAILCGASLAFLFAINDFAVPDYISSVGKKFNVYADEVFAGYQVAESTGKAILTSVPLVLLTMLCLAPSLWLRRRGSLATLGGTFRRPAPLRLGVWRLPATLFCWLVAGVLGLLPIGRLIFEAGGGPGEAGWSFSGMQTAFALALERSREDLANSLAYSAAAASIALPLALVLGHFCERARQGRLWELLLSLPMAVPAILFGIGQIALWNHSWSADFYDSGALVVLLNVGRFLIFPILLISAAVASQSARLEEAGRVSGIGPATRLVKLVAPPIRSTLLAGWAMVFVLSMRELDATILVPAANHTVIFRVFNQIHFGRDDFVAALCLLIIFFLLLPGMLWSLFGRHRVEVLP
ncbi:MAG: iron(III) transport system permease protein, partial [Candidatus Paceibacteria bacterium]